MSFRRQLYFLRICKLLVRYWGSFEVLLLPINSPMYRAWSLQLTFISNIMIDMACSSVPGILHSDIYILISGPVTSILWARWCDCSWDACRQLLKPETQSPFQVRVIATLVGRMTGSFHSESLPALKALLSIINVFIGMRYLTHFSQQDDKAVMFRN